VFDVADGVNYTKHIFQFCDDAFLPSEIHWWYFQMSV